MPNAFPQGIDLTPVTNMLAQYVMKQGEQSAGREAFSNFLQTPQTVPNPIQRPPTIPGPVSDQKSLVTGEPLRYKTLGETPPVANPDYMTAIANLVNNPYGANAFKAWGSMQPQFKEIPAGTTYGQLDPATNQFSQTGQTDFKTSPLMGFDAQGNPVYSKMQGGQMVTAPSPITTPQMANAQKPTITAKQLSTGEYGTLQTPHRGGETKFFGSGAIGPLPFGGMGGADGSKLSPGAIDAMARDMLLTGKSPAMGMGGAGLRVQVYNRYGELARQQGLDTQARAVMSRTTQAEGANLSNITKQRSMVMSFEQTAEKNLDLALAQSGKVDRFGSPVLNRWRLWVQGQGLGDPEVAKFNAAVKVATNEVAKVTSTTTGNLVPEQERIEFSKLLNASLSPEQFKGVVDILKQDMGNRRVAYDEEIQNIRNNFPSLNEGKPNNIKDPYKPGMLTPSDTTTPPSKYKILKIE